jgi:hypothetical protein
MHLHRAPAAAAAAQDAAPAPQPTPNSSNPVLESRTRFRDFASLSQQLIASIPFEHCTEVGHPSLAVR